MSMHHRIDLIWLTGESELPIWSLGDVHPVASSPAAVHDLMGGLATSSQADAFLFWNATLGLPDVDTILGVAERPGNLWHAGLCLGSSGQPGILDFIQPTWMFNRDPDPAIEATSWRLSLSACLMQAEVLRQMGPVNAEFRTLQGAALELGHRYITRGVLTRHIPQMLPDTDHPAMHGGRLPFEDELRFAYLRFGRQWSIWALGRAVLSRYVTVPAGVRAWRRIARQSVLRHTQTFNALEAVESVRDPAAAQVRSSVSVIVPTVDRYPYLETLLAQLRDQTVMPAEIIVVDQTPVSRRNPVLYKRFGDLPLRVIYQEQPGQCSSRNQAIQQSAGKYVLFLDDDDEIPTDLIEKHLVNLRHYDVSVSCGTAHEVGTGCLPENFTYARPSDVFPTNNSLVCRSALGDSGLFDLAYERGQRADGDLGMRVYLSGRAAFYNPDIAVLHHHAPRGGLRIHKARVITYASSRQKLSQRHLPSVSEIYLAKRYFTARQVRESLWLRAFGTFAMRGSFIRRLLKILIGIVYLPNTIGEIRKREKKAQAMLRDFPQIPTLSPTEHHQEGQDDYVGAD